MLDFCSWDEVDPRAIPFDHEQALAVVAGLGPAADVPVRPAGTAAAASVIAWSHGAGRAWTEAMNAALIDHYGEWAFGWRWAMSEPGGGGPVGAWCCPRDSITTREETLARVAAALVEWRQWLEELAGRFDGFPLAGLPEEDRQIAWERGAAQLVTVVVGRTHATDAWYTHCAQVLIWFLTRWGIPPERAGVLVEEAIGGRFGSWAEPAGTVIDDVAGRLGRSLLDVVTGDPDA